MALESSEMKKVKISLPEKLAQEAQAKGLLKPDAMTELLANELNRRQRVDQLFDAVDRLADVTLPALTDEEVEQELSKAREK